MKFRYFVRHFLYAIVFTVCFSACSKNEKGNAKTDKEVVLKADAFDSTRSNISKRLAELFSLDSIPAYGVDTIKSSGSLSGLYEREKNLYKRNNYQPFWLYEERIQQILEVLHSAHSDGLNPEDYQYSALKKAYTDYLKDGITTDEALFLETGISRSVLLYVNHLYKGKADPRTIFPEWNYKEPASEIVSDSMLVCYFTSNLDSLPIILRPKYEIYHALRKTLKLVDSLGGQAIYLEKIPYVEHTLVLGDTSYTIYAIKKRLQSTSEYNIDSLNNVFDLQLYESIKTFQTHVGVSASGKLDKRTIDKLNFTVEEVRSAILVNMERFRWLPNDLPKEFVLVNIADYTLRHFIDRNVVYEESVIVGREYTSTPVFEAMMTYIEFNPYWTVPRSIAVKEMLPSLKRNPNYLQSHNMDLFNGNTAVGIPGSFTNYTADNFPFTIRENPGPKNSLGQVKLMFPNPYSIYLHDTPGKYLFERDERSFSHGCIRLKDPLKFALHILSKQGITQAQIDKIIRDKKNYVISLKEKLPVMITYFTCYSKKGDSHLYFFKDIYGKDQKIIDALQEKIL
ncbi:MAG TPA: L,D-transpeptidase family protein [Cytophaga sp.]|jgi:murein L,D-transpeptidase YcbB/YkuD|nr:L,D-transpeptidase family protein [Cytophaga sp.]